MGTVVDLCQHLPKKKFDAGQIVLEDGGKSGVLYILADGAVEILKGDFQINTVSEPGSFLGEISLLLDLPHIATVKTLEPSTFYVADDPPAFLRSNPEIAFSLSRLLAKRLHYVTTYLVDIKRQFEGNEDHLGIVDEVLETLVHHQEEESTPGSDRYPDTKVD